ncbi:MAG: type II toxin-antitoxin system prevent-host-death family antitoxin [Verrucomicrobiota bacterium]|jgi:prevent-host-death family protein
MPTISNRFRRSRAVVGTFQAKTHFSQLLERVAKGEEITITKRDRPVARLVPAERPSRENVASIFRQMDALRQSLPASKDKTTLKDLIKHGRRF